MSGVEIGSLNASHEKKASKEERRWIRTEALNFMMPCTAIHDVPRK